MCGISGIFATKLNEALLALNTQIMHSQTARGPDHQDQVVIKSAQSEVVLGHNRLSIIDLSNHANQPMWDSSGRYCVVYNGEIYNYIELRAELIAAGLQFNTASDTEVILNAFAHWGIAALTHLQGPFAFALYDKETAVLWLCRDRFAIRPLYYTINNDVLYFASSTQVLAKALNLPPNMSYITRGLQYLVYEDGSASSAYENLHVLPAGCYLHAKLTAEGALVHTIHSYYDLQQQVATQVATLSTYHTNDLLQLITEKLEHAVQIRLRSDVPLAISLSGGLDSSSVAALVSQQHRNTIGFSFAHPQNKKTEGPLVAKCADYLGIHIEYVWPTQQEMVAALFKTIAVQDAPFASLSIVAQYLLYQHVRSCGIKVLLGGQGGDEVFMGYKKFLLFKLKAALKQKRYAETIKNILYLLPMLIAETQSLGAYWQHRHRYLAGKPQSTANLQLPPATPLNLQTSNQTLWQRQLQDITQFSLPTLLRYEDRNAMGNSVESRLPYMDQQLLELGLALPEAIKLHRGYGKWAIRQIMHNKIPKHIRWARYKRGFDIPLAPLLQTGLGKAIRERLHTASHVQNYLPPAASINQLFSDQAFLNRPQTMAEAITLLWLNKVYA